MGFVKFMPSPAGLPRLALGIGIVWCGFGYLEGARAGRTRSGS